MIRSLLKAALAWSIPLVLLASLGASAHEEPRRPPVSLRDFWFYACVLEYAKAHGQPVFDNSVAYAVENSAADADQLDRSYESARAFAATLRTPDPKDPEHGGVAVAAQCLEESRSERVGKLIAGPWQKSQPQAFPAP